MAETSTKYMEKQKDWELMNLVKEKNTMALKALYEKHNRSIFNFILRYTGDKEIAQDILQETFTRVWYAAHTFDKAKGNFKSWLFTIGLNITRNEMTKKRYAYNYVGIENIDGNYHKFNHYENEHPEIISEKADSKKIIEQALGELKPYLREVIILKHYNQLKFREIAEITKTPEGTLKARFHKAIAELKEKLESVEI